MKYMFIFTLLISLESFAQNSADRLCEVKICNKLSRVSLDPFKHMKDSFGKTCFTATVPEKDAVRGKILDSESRWYQGSFNPTKKSVTKIEEVYGCK